MKHVKTYKVDLGKGDYVFVRQMTAHEFMDFFSASGEYWYSLAEEKAKMAAHVLCDEQGVLLLEPEDYLLLSQNLSITNLNKIYDCVEKMYESLWDSIQVEAVPAGYQVKPRGNGLYNILDAQGKVVNETALRQADAQKLLEDLA